MKTFELDRRQRIARPQDEVFAFFSQPSNLERLTPPWLNFHIVGMSTPTIGEGTLIDYRLRLRGLPLRWRSRILDWNPPHGFVDEQLEGPYRSWVHRHGFQRDGAHTLVTDNVRYAVLGGALINRWWSGRTWSASSTTALRTWRRCSSALRARFRRPERRFRDAGAALPGPKRPHSAANLKRR